jgi:hypothetical protein
MLSIQLPSDEREAEVLIASILGFGTILWTILEIISLPLPFLHPWATLTSCLLLLYVLGDAFLAQARGLKRAIQGFERLLLRDEDRQSQLDSAAFLAGYLLGLPCFCFQAQSAEALKMLRSNTEDLRLYQTKIDSKGRAMINTDRGSEEILFDSGRVLVWLMAPVAAEMLKYGKTLFSDPRR